MNIPLGQTLRPSAGLTLLFLISSLGQTDDPGLVRRFTLGDDCGDPSVESQIYAYRRGKVTKILSSSEFQVQFVPRTLTPGKKRFTIRLVGISPNANPSEVKKFLNEHVLNHSVEVVGNSRKKKDTRYGAIVRIYNEEGEIDELNEYMLENGIAQYSDFDSDNLVPYYWPCRLEKAQERAKLTKLGIWNR